MPGRLLGGIEAGGTKFICVLARETGEELEQVRIATTTPAATFADVLEFFDAAIARHGRPQAFGIAGFGPLELRRDSPQWGQLLATPKPHWSNADLVGPLRSRYGLPVGIDTDVNAAALAEQAQAFTAGVSSLAYVTVGTGIGGGAVLQGRTLSGLMHPEMGHIRVRRDSRDTEFSGCCPFHGDCLEGLASGPAIQARWDRPLDAPGADPQAQEIIAGYLGQMAATISLLLSPERIVLGGGVMQCAGLLPLIRRATLRELAGYLPLRGAGADLEHYIVAPALGTRSGIVGALRLAAQAGRDG